MSAAKHATLGSSQPPKDLFAALLQVVQSGKYELGGVSNESHQMLFKSGATAMSWGHYFAADVAPTGGGSTLRLSAMGVPGAPRSLMDGRKNKKAAEKLIEAVNDVMHADGPPSPEPVESFALLEDGTSVPWTEGDFPGA